MASSTVSGLANSLKVFGFLCVVAFGAVAVIHWKRAHIDVGKALGLTLDRRTALEFCVGSLIGTAAMLAIFSVESLFRLHQIQTVGLTGHHVLRNASSYLISGFVEELLCRGFLLSGLIFVFYWRGGAVVLMAAIFGLLHIANPHATALSVLSNGLGGIVYAVAYLGSKRLWLGTGIHFAWNFVQGPILGFPVSGGTVLWGGLVSQSVSGPDWLTGGAYGPEGGLISVLFRFVVVGLLVFWCSRTRKQSPHVPKHAAAGV